MAQRLVVWGTGGVGGYVAAALARSGLEVSALTTPRHVEAIESGGLSVERNGDAERIDLAVSADPKDIGQADVVICALKLYHLDAHVDDLAPLIGDNTRVLTLQNGVAAPELIHRAFPDVTVAPGLVTMVSEIVEPGHIRLIGPLPRIRCDARAGGSADEDGQTWIDRVDPAWLRITCTDSLAHDLWVKFALIATFGGTCALADTTIGAICAHPETAALMEDSLREVRAVAAASGVELTDADLAGIVRTLRGMDPASTTSMQRDIAQGRASELDYLNGHIVDLARGFGIDVPFHRIVTAVLHERLTRA